MDGLTLLEQAAERGLMVTLAGDNLDIRGPGSCVDLVEAIRQHKAEVIAALKTEETPDPASWEVLSAQRWGGADDSPGIDIPADDWRWEVAGWPIERWLAWHRRAGALEAEEVNPEDGPAERAGGIRRAQRRAYDEMTSQEGTDHGR